MSIESILDDFRSPAGPREADKAHKCVTGANGRCTCPMPAYRLLDQPCVIAAIAAGTVALVIAWVVLAAVIR